MYTNRINRKNLRWNLVFQPCKYFVSPNFREHSCCHSSSHLPIAGNYISQSGFSQRFLSDSFSSMAISSSLKHTSLHAKLQENLKSSQFRFYSSEGDGRNTSENKSVPLKEVANFDKEKIQREKIRDDVSYTDSHALLGEQDQKEWFNNEKLAMENKKRESPFLSMRERFKNEFLHRIVPWEKITVSWKTFPYYINESTKSLLVECVASHLKHKKASAAYGAHLTSSCRRILLQSVPGTELYRERLVRALARDLQVPLLVLDSSVLALHDFAEECSSDDESDDDAAESSEECTSESEVDNENNASNDEEWTSSGDVRSGGSDDEADVHATVKALKELVSEESVNSSDSSKSEAVETSEKTKQPLKKGDRVKYIGPSIEEGKRIILGKIPSSDGLKKAYTVIHGRSLSSGQRGEIYEVDGDKVAVILDFYEKKTEKGEKDVKLMGQSANSSLCWIHAKDIEVNRDAEAEEGYIAMEALCEVLYSVQPLIVYFPDYSLLLSGAVSKSNRKEFVHKVHEMFENLAGPIVLICGQNKVDTGSKEKEKFTMIFPNLGHLAKLPLPLKRLAEGFKVTKRSGDNEIYKLFTNVMHVSPPKDENLLRTFNKQIEEDRKIVVSRSSLNELRKVIEEHELSCMDLLHVDTGGVILTKQKAEKVVGWAKNHYLSSCLVPLVKGGRLDLPRESLEIVIMRLKEQETLFQKPSHKLQNLAKDEYESNFVSAVVPPGEIGVKFDDIGALEDVKKALNELVILPMRRPELFSRGNLLRPCKGILLFGPPGTGKTLLAKALATEAGANFISVTGSTLTSKWFGDAEKLTKALFSFASKLAPVIIFVDEVDSLLGARGRASEHEASRRMQNEFMAAWDGLRSKDSQKILILGATNRPFDLDDAVIRRLPRRIYVDLPDAVNRLKIFQVILAQENLEARFQFENLANATEGYSGSDLKNLCIAAAYRPVQELLEEEKKGGRKDMSSVLRPLNMDDFIQSKAKVGPSVAYDATSMNELRKWNEQYGEGGSRRKSPFGFGS